MHAILYNTFGESSPIQLKQLTESDYKKIPLLNQIKFLIELIKTQGELKLTAKGYLPPKIVKHIYNQGFLRDELIEHGISKLSKELDSNTILLTRILCEISGITKKRKNILSLTKKGEKLSKNDFDLLIHLFFIFSKKFNWGCFDGYRDDTIGQLGCGFTLILLSKYGDRKRKDQFYADKYFTAFPMLIDPDINPIFESTKRVSSDCYSIRTFDRFLDHLGLVKIIQARKWNTDKFITKTDLFDSFIQCTPPIPLDTFRDFRA